MKRTPVLTAAAVMFAAAASASLTTIPSASAQSWRENLTSQSEGSGSLRDLFSESRGNRGALRQQILDELQSRGALQDELMNRLERRRALRELIENRLGGEGAGLSGLSSSEGYGRSNIDRILDRLERRRMLRELIENRLEGEGGGLSGLSSSEGYGRGNIDRILDRLERRRMLREFIENKLEGGSGLRGLSSEGYEGEGGMSGLSSSEGYGRSNIDRILDRLESRRMEGGGRIRQLLSETPERDLRQLIREHLQERAALLDLVSQCIGEHGGRFRERISQGGGGFGQSSEDRQAVRELILDRLRSNPDLEQTLNRLRDRISGQG